MVRVSVYLVAVSLFDFKSGVFIFVWFLLTRILITFLLQTGLFSVQFCTKQKLQFLINLFNCKCVFVQLMKWNKKGRYYQ